MKILISPITYVWHFGRIEGPATADGLFLLWENRPGKLHGFYLLIGVACCQREYRRERAEPIDRLNNWDRF